jgi:hypothetical protein
MPVPVLGQPFAVLNCTVSPTIKCNCERGGVLTLMAIQRVGGWIRTQDACPSCGKLFTLAGLNIDQQGQLQISVEMGVPVGKPELVSQ